MNRYRRISANERAYLAAARYFPPLAIQLWIRSVALPPLPALERALQRAAEANPGARLVRSGRWWCDSGRAPALRELIPEQPFTATHALFREPFADAREAPQIEVVAVRGAGIVFRCAHALMDARGLLFFAEETFAALRGEQPHGTSRNVSDEDFLRELDHAERRGWPTPTSASPVGAADSATQGFLWDHRAIRGSTTLNARIMATLTELALRGEPGGEAAFLVPVDLRRAAGDFRTTGNMSNALMLRFREPTQWTEVYQRNLGALARQRERAFERRDALVHFLPSGMLSGLQRAVHRHCVRRGRYLFSAVVSNIGDVSLARLSGAGFAAQSACFLPTDAPGVALTLVITRHDHGTEIHASAPAATADRGRLAQVMDALCAASVEERQAIESGETPNTSLLDLFASQAAATPHARALSERESTWSYAALDQRAWAWAARLRAQGVSPGDRVAILASRSMDMVAALLGILRTGAAFVPLEDSWPRARIAQVLDDCRPACLLTDSNDAGLADLAPILRMAGELPSAAASPVTAPSQTDTAYVMYTSGSTGRPKGVVVSHGALSNYLTWARERYVRPHERAVFPLFTSVAFDLTQTSLWLPLISGGELRVIAERDALLAARAIAADGEITAIKLTPSHLRLLCEVGLESSVLRTFVVGGEALTTSLANQTLKQRADATVFNEYGPTEATVGCVVHEFDPAADQGPQVPIGQPIAHTRIHLLDADGRETDRGEIVISGRCLATGYLTPSPADARFTTVAGHRAYRSGDLGSRVGGKLHYHGRTDEQVKVRGHRIELGDVEAAIAAHDSVAAVAVITEGDTRLVGFVEWRGDPQPEALREALARMLPEYMVPARIETVGSLPLTANGKVDKHALSGASAAPAATAVEVEPASLHRELVQLAAEVMAPASTPLQADLSLLDQGWDSLHLAILLNRSARRFLTPAQAERFFEDLGSFVAAPTLLQLRALLHQQRDG